VCYRFELRIGKLKHIEIDCRESDELIKIEEQEESQG
jgi:hypothetical protein